MRGAARERAAKDVADAVVAQVEREGEEHLGRRRMRQLREVLTPLREALTPLREITDPYA